MTLASIRGSTAVYLTGWSAALVLGTVIGRWWQGRRRSEAPERSEALEPHE